MSDVQPLGVLLYARLRLLVSCCMSDAVHGIVFYRGSAPAMVLYERRSTGFRVLLATYYMVPVRIVLCESAT